MRRMLSHRGPLEAQRRPQKAVIWDQIFCIAVYPPHVSALYKYIRIYLYTFRRPGLAGLNLPVTSHQQPSTIFGQPQIYLLAIMIVLHRNCRWTMVRNCRKNHVLRTVRAEYTPLAEKILLPQKVVIWGYPV